jgi:hypothetical protein
VKKRLEKKIKKKEKQIKIKTTSFLRQYSTTYDVVSCVCIYVYIYIYAQLAIVSNCFQK